MRETNNNIELKLPKKKKRLNSKELIHLWCNGKIDKEINSGNYRFTKTEFCIKKKLIDKKNDTRNI